jgi:hypothetical protein
MKNIYAIFIIGFIIFGTAFTTILSPKWVVEYTSNYDDDVYEFVDYWYNTISMQKFEEAKGIEQEVILSKLWLETHGGHLGAGRRGALFGIKRKNGSKRQSIKGYDSVDDEAVDYAGYEAGWESFSHFCDFIKKPLYQTRFEAWQKVLPDYPEWHLRLLSLQVHPDMEKSKLAYAAVGCKDGTKSRCYAKRKAHAQKGIDFVIKYLRIENDKWEGVVEIDVATDEVVEIIGPIPPTNY